MDTGFGIGALYIAVSSVFCSSYGMESCLLCCRNSMNSKLFLRELREIWAHPFVSIDGP